MHILYLIWLQALKTWLKPFIHSLRLLYFFRGVYSPDFFFSAALISPAQPHNFLLGTLTLPAFLWAHPLFSSPAILVTLSSSRHPHLCICVFPYLEQGAVALQPGGAEWGDGAEAAPEVDAWQQRTVSQQQTRGSLWGGDGEKEESEGGDIV